MLRMLLSGAQALCLSALLTGCVNVPPAPDAMPCRHPLIDPTTNAGLADAVAAYWSAVEECNRQNGQER